MWVAMNALVLFCWMPMLLRLAVSFGLGGKLDGKVISLYINTCDIGGNQFLVAERV